MLVFKAEHNILMHPSTCWELPVYSVGLCSLLCRLLVTSSLVRELPSRYHITTVMFGQEETYNIVAAHGYFDRLIFPYTSFLIHATSMLSCCWPVIGIWFAALGV